MEAMVSVDRVIYLLESPSGQRKVADEKGRDELLAAGWKLAGGVRQPVDSDKTLLTVSTNDAILIGLCKIRADTAGDLAAQRNLHLIATLNAGAGEWIIELLNSGVSRMILLSIFMTCLYAALHAPGHGMAEVLALLTLGLLIGVPLLTGYAQWWEIVLIFLGLGLVALEIFVIPGFGVVGILGAVFMLAGFVFTFAAPEVGRSPLSLPKLAVTWNGLERGLFVTFGGLVCSLMLSMWLRRYLPKIPYFKGLILNTTVGSSEAAMVGSLTNIDPVATGPAIGATGTATTDLRPGGSAEFHDSAGGSHVVAVISDGGYVARGDAVVVRESSGNRVIVRPVSQV
jgi:membrane-bound serine protease (ClpP class)